MQAYLLLLATLSRTTALQATRRRAMNAASAAAASVVLPQAPASAFANAVPEAAKYADRKKRRGPAPQNLGLKNREADGADVEWAREHGLHSMGGVSRLREGLHHLAEEEHHRHEGHH